MKYELYWTKKEKNELCTRILNLRKDQIAALLNLTGLNFNLNDIEKVVEEILKNKEKSGHLDILLSEAKSKEILLWWINFFEKNK
jgi:hypothetical protein